MKVGIGYDAHRFAEGRDLIIGGVKIPYEKGLDGHSDADVLVHAVIDALMGAANIGDIGKMFPDSDDTYKGISSLELLRQTAKMLYQRGYYISNIDAVVIMQKPKISEYTYKMSEKISNALGIHFSKVNVKGKTEEYMGFTGSGEGVKAIATCAISATEIQ